MPEAATEPPASLVDARSTWTVLGTLAPTAIGLVDARGRVSPGPGRWSLDWWIGAEDRWRLPAREVGVRQQLIGAAPVVETAMRVPGGDAVQRAYAVRTSSRQGGGALLVVEVENRSAVPFAVALAIGGARIERISMTDGAVVLVEGRPALLLGKPPARTAASTRAGADCANIVLSGAAVETSVDVACPDGGAEAAFVFPLAHRATLRVALPLDEPAAALPPAVPTAVQVADGWAAQTRRGLRLDLPDPRLVDAWQACRRSALLLARASVAPDLDRLGFHREAAEALRADPDDPAVLLGLADHWRLTRDRELVTELLPRVVALVSSRRWAKRASLEALLAAADLLAAAGEPTAAADARRAAAAAATAHSVTRSGALAPVRVTESLWERLDTASPTWTWAGIDPAEAAAELCRLVRGLVLADGEDGVALCPELPAGWAGQSVDVGDAPTPFGQLSYAVRWHGERPALLWELRPHADLAAPPVLTAPGLDQTWRTTKPTGEALLGPRP